MPVLNGQVALVTGATSGMALATAKLFVEEGAHVYITGRRQEQLDRAATALGSGATAVQADSAVPADLDRVFAAVGAGHGRLDVLFASAGGGSMQEPLSDVTERSFDDVFAVNVRGTLFTVQKALPFLSYGASIVLNGSAAYIEGIPGLGVYSAAKAAIRSFARTWTKELADRDIRVNVVNPAFIRTATFDGFPPDALEQMAEIPPAKRWGTPEDIARTVLFLASDDSSFIRGSEVFVDGGATQV